MQRLAWVLALTVAWQGAAAAAPKKTAAKKVAVTPVDAGVPDAAEDVPVNPDPCARNLTCPSCVTSVTASCGWCVDTATCVYRDDGACGASFMAGLATQCPPPGPARAPLPKASTMAVATTQTVNVAPQPMPDEAFEALLEGFKEEPSEALRLTALEQASKTYFFRVTQAMEVVDTFQSLDAKLKVCELLRKRVADRQNLFQFYGRFRQEADRKKAQKIMEAKG